MILLRYPSRGPVSSVNLQTIEVSLSSRLVPGGLTHHETEPIGPPALQSNGKYVVNMDNRDDCHTSSFNQSKYARINLTLLKA